MTKKYMPLSVNGKIFNKIFGTKNSTENNSSKIMSKAIQTNILKKD